MIVMFPFNASPQGNQQLSPSSDPRTLALHLQQQNQQRLQMLQQQIMPMCPSLQGHDASLLPSSPFAPPSRPPQVDAIVAAAAEKIATDAAIAACLNSLQDIQNQRRRLLFIDDLSRQLQTAPSPQPIPQARPKPSVKKEPPMSPEPPANSSFPSERQSLDLSASIPSPGTAIRVVKTLGTTLRSKADKFVDVHQFPVLDVGPDEKRRGASVFFPEILYRLLLEVEGSSLTNVISFLPHGRAFRVHNKQEFERDLLPRYFSGQSKWSSFSRQLNLYGFLRVSTGPDYGAYYHELFVRGRPDLCNYMRRVGKPHGLDRRKFKLAEGEDPDFYKLPEIPAMTALGTAADQRSTEQGGEQGEDDRKPSSSSSTR